MQHKSIRLRREEQLIGFSVQHVRQVLRVFNTKKASVKAPFIDLFDCEQYERQITHRKRAPSDNAAGEQPGLPVHRVWRDQR